MLSVGDAFPRVKLPALSGGERSVTGGVARVTLVTFGHSDCGTTKLALPVVDRLAAGRRDDGEVLCVLQEDATTARKLADELALRLPILLDEAPYAASAALGLVTVPTLFTLDVDGVVSGLVEGYSRRDLEALAEPVGLTAPLFADDDGPARRPG